MDQAVLFDLDGTLLNSLEDIALCGNTALEISGLSQHTLEEYRSYIGNGTDMLLRRMMTKEEFLQYGARVKSDYMALYGDLCSHGCKPYPGILEMLQTLQQHGIRTAVVSNKPDSQTRAVWMSTFGSALDLAQGQLDGVPIKPDAAGPREALRRLGAGCIAYVGDSDVDIFTAKNLGVLAVGVTWGMRSRRVLEESGADLLADTVSELTQLLLEHAGNLEPAGR